MRKTIASILLILMLLVSACSPKNEEPDGDIQENETPSKTVVENEDTASSEATPEPYTDAEQPCKPFSIIDDILKDTLPNVPPVSEDDWAFGPEDAKVTFLEYSQFPCGFCVKLEPMLVAVQAAFPEDVRLVFRHWPLRGYDKALLTGQAVEAAGRQGKFVELKNLLFEEHGNWNTLSVSKFEDYLKEKAQELNLDVALFTQDLYNEEIVAKLVAAQDNGIELGFRGTPALLINGMYWPNEQISYDNFLLIVKLAKFKDEEIGECPPFTIDTTKEYTATITTSKGDITVDLFAEQTPTTVNNFVFLAQEGWYDNNSLLAVDDNSILTGDPSGTRFGGPGYAFMDEISEEITFTEAGMVAMYNWGPGKNGSMFFITKNGLEGLNGLYTIFGKVIEGMDVINTLTKEDTILSITITES